MSIKVKPDPAHPLGGYALIVVDGALPPGPHSLTILDLYGDRYLGPNGWQSAPVTLGPFDASIEAGAAVLAVDTKVVDHIEEYARLRITVAGMTADVDWPDTVRPSPKNAGADGLKVAAPGIDAPAPASALERTTEAAAPVSEPEPVTPPVMPAADPVPEEPKADPPPRTLNRGLLLLAAFSALAIVGAAVWWLQQQDPAPSNGGSTARACGQADLTAAANLPLADAFRKVAACGAEGDPELRFQVIEAAAAAGNGEAIAMIGRWYDPDEAAAVGSSFTSPDPAQAARYYLDALNAGFMDAEPLLVRVCTTLRTSSDPLQELARERYCPPP